MELRRKWNSSPPRRFDQEDLDQVRVNPNLDSDEDSAQGDSDVNFLQEDSRGGSQRLVQDSNSKFAKII